LILHNNAGPLGTALAIPNVTLLEAPWANREAETDVCWPYPEIVDGDALPLEGPGLGIAANIPLVDEASGDEELAASKPFVLSLPGPRRRGPVECAGWVGAGFLSKPWKTSKGVTNLKRGRHPYRLRLRLFLRGRVGRGLGRFFLLGLERVFAEGAGGFDAGFSCLKQAHHDIRS
jgi:hypothetical protein